MSNSQNKSLSQKYQVPIIIVSFIFILIVFIALMIWPDQTNTMAGMAFHFLTDVLGAPIQLISFVVLIAMVVFCFTKYGNIRLGYEKPEYSTMSWLGMIFFCVNGSGTMYWAFLEWGNHFNANPMIYGAAVSEAYRYETAMSYAFYDWGPACLLWILIFTIPFTYWYQLKKEKELRFSTICKPILGEKRVNGIWGKILDIIFVAAVIGCIAMTAGSAATTIANAIADLFNIPSTFGLAVGVLLGTAVIFFITSMLGVDKGMKRISDWNVYITVLLIGAFLIFGPFKFIIKSIVNSLGLLTQNFVRMSLWTDPVAESGYPQNWTTFYLIYGLIFGPVGGVFAARVSKGRTIRQLFLGMMAATFTFLVLTHGILGGFQQFVRINHGGLDVPAMISNGQTASIASKTLQLLPFAKFFLVLYIICNVLFLATTLDSSALSLASSTSINLPIDKEPNRGLKLFWCIALIGLPIGISFAGTNIDTLRSVVLILGLPLFLIVYLSYHSLFKDIMKNYKHKSKDEIILEGMTTEERESYENIRKR